ncbi:MAG: DUF6334 family protein [Hormoscilla sp.]
MSMVDEFPIGETLTEVSIVEYKEFGGDELCLDKVQLIFPDRTVILQPLADTDEIEIILKSTTLTSLTNHPTWCSSLLGKKLQTVWVCENDQGYQDQIIFAFDRLHPSIAFIAEGSVLKAFHCEQILKFPGSST